MSVFPLNPQDRENANEVMSEAYHDGSAKTVEAHCDRLLDALEGAGWTLLPPGTAIVQGRLTGDLRSFGGTYPGARPEWRVVGPWTPKETTT